MIANKIDESVGVDIEDIGRFRKLDQKNSGVFLKKVYTKNELDYCFQKSVPAQHLAVRFAGKEAVLKALSGLGLSPVDYNTIEIFNNDRGAPQVRFCGHKNFKKLGVKISLSHCRDKALAFVVIKK